MRHRRTKPIIATRTGLGFMRMTFRLDDDRILFYVGHRAATRSKTKDQWMGYFCRERMEIFVQAMDDLGFNMIRGCRRAHDSDSRRAHDSSDRSCPYVLRMRIITVATTGMSGSFIFLSLLNPVVIPGAFECKNWKTVPWAILVVTKPINYKCRKHASPREKVGAACHHSVNGH